MVRWRGKQRALGRFTDFMVREKGSCYWAKLDHHIMQEAALQKVLRLHGISKESVVQSK